MRYIPRNVAVRLELNHANQCSFWTKQVIVGEFYASFLYSSPNSRPLSSSCSEPNADTMLDVVGSFRGCLNLIGEPPEDNLALFVVPTGRDAGEGLRETSSSSSPSRESRAEPRFSGSEGGRQSGPSLRSGDRNVVILVPIENGRGCWVTTSEECGS